MSDPQRIADEDQRASTLFQSTSRLAGQAAARSITSRREKILHHLKEVGPGTLFEIAAYYNLYDHQISGRFTELARDGLVVRTGQRKRKPETDCDCDVWKLADDVTPIVHQLATAYPDTLIIPGDGTFLRQSILDKDEAPGIPYSLHDDGGRIRLAVRVELLECGQCGRTLKMVQETIDGKPQKVYRCGTEGCRRTWHLQLVREPGGCDVLALVMKTF